MIDRVIRMPPPVFTHPACLDHDPGPGHPESPARLEAILRRINETFPGTIRETEPAPLDLIERVHPRSYLDYLAAFSASGGGPIDGDTVVTPASWPAALGAAGAALAAVRHAHQSNGSAFAAIRPPGHHALRETAMGFCLLGNAVIAAREAQALGREKVLIVDWDVHHGNGTQALVEHDPSIRFVSMHQDPWYPGTGAADERGVGNVFNIPRPGGLPRTVYARDFLAGVDAALAQWSPDILLVSAGFDSLAGDPLGEFTLEPDDIVHWTEALRERMKTRPVVGVLEGGYRLDLLAAGVVAHVRALS